MTTQWPSPQPWRVCVTRDEAVAGPLSSALRAQAFQPVLCPVLTELPPADPAPLAAAARELEHYDWLVCASARAVRALADARAEPWPPALRAAAAGEGTAQALRRAGVASPVTAAQGGAEPLWALLADLGPWATTPVLVPTTPGGRPVLVDNLRAAGARVHEVEAYRMAPRDPAAIARDWAAAAPEAVVIASPRVARILVAAVGAGALAGLRAVVAIGATTAAALHDMTVPCLTAEATSFPSAAAALAARRAAEAHA